MKPARLWLPLLAATLLLCVAVAAWQWGSPRLLFKVVSPQGAYQLEFHSASLPQQLAHRGLAVPGFFRLYRVASPPQLMGEGPVVDLLVNRQVDWTSVETGELTVRLRQEGLVRLPAECQSPCDGTAAKHQPPSTVR